MKPVLNLIFIILAVAAFVGIRILFSVYPNDNERLSDAQNNYSENSIGVIDNHWAYYIINPENPLDEDFTVSLDTVQGTFVMDERCAEYARRMIEDAQNDGIKLTVVSAYRSFKKQQENLDSYIQRLINEGHSEADAIRIAHNEIALPYTSEHNAGLALDILTEDWWLTHDDVTADFENTEEFRWLQENAHKYGFIMRYPKEYESVTGYTYEPWHYRFIGVYYAGKIKESGLPLEYFYKTNF